MKKAAPKFIGLLLAIGLLFALPHPAAAYDDNDDPPSRVARLGYIQGAVSFEPAGTEDWVDAEINRPITSGDRLWTDQGSRAELHMGSASIHLSGETGFSFLDLNDRITQIRLTEGSINVRVRRLYRDETFEIDTPNLAFTIWQPGRYRITVDPNGDTTTIAVREGQGEVTGGGSAYTLYADDLGTFSGYDRLDAVIDGINGQDSFDRWSYQRDRRIDHSVSARYVSQDAIGYEDLDQYGGWRPTREYGTVWFPHVQNTNWAPYRYGHWDWIAPWGWTWIDDEPWGFAPFHYGRWINDQGSWGWVPCPPQRTTYYGNDYGGGVYDRGEYVRPVYAPALVAWVGGSGFAVSVGSGGGGQSIGWFPLAPREVYVPSYPASRRYVENVNVTNTTVNTTVVNTVYNNTTVNNNTTTNTVNNNIVNNATVTNVKYVNQTAPNAVTATTAQAFTSAKPVANNVVQVNEKQLAAAPVAPVAPLVAPPKQAVLGSGPAATAKPPATMQERPVVAKVAPPPPPPSFEARSAAIQQNGGKPLSVTQEKKLQPEMQKQQAAAAPVVKIAPPAQPAAPRVDNSPKASVRQSEASQPPQTRPGGQPPQAPAPGNTNGAATPANQSSQNNAARPAAAQPPQQQQNVAPQNNPNRPLTAQPPQQQQRQNTAPQNNPNRPPAAQPPQQQQNAAPFAPTRSPMPDPKLEEKHQQEQLLLQQKQDQERQRVEQEHRQQQLALEQQKTNEEKQRQAQLEQQRQQQLKQQQALEQKNANDQKQRQLQQEQQRQQQLAAEQQKANEEKQRLAQQELQRQQQQKLVDLEQKHAQEQRALEQKQEQEHQQQLQQQQQRQQQQQQQRPQPPPPPQSRQQQPPPPPPQQRQQQPPPKQDPNKKPDPNSNNHP